MKEVSTISKRKSRSRPQNRRQQPRPVNKGYGDAGASWHKKATKGFRAMSGSPKEDIDANNYTLRQRARMLYMAAPIATSAIRTNRTNVVGIGLQLKSRIDREALGMTQEAADAWQAQAEREFALWSENKRACDATGVNNFAAMQQLALSSWLVSGDVFAVVKQYEPTPLTPYSLRLHLIEADRVATPTTSGIITPMLLTTGKAANGNTIYDGVEVNDDGQIEAYHIRSTYPFELGSTTTTWARVQAYGERTGLPNILHVMESERPDQYRGVSYLAQVIEPLLQLRRYTESELTAAVVESFFTAFIKTEAGAGDNPFNEVGSSLPEVSRDPNEYEMGPGQINIMEPGEDVTFADPKRPAKAMQKQAALGAKHLKDAKADNDESGAAGVGAAPNGGEEGSENDDKAKIGVAAAEQLYVGQGRGEEKKQYVLDFLKQKGFKVDEESVVNAIEAIVKQLNTEGLTIE